MAHDQQVADVRAGDEQDDRCRREEAFNPRPEFQLGLLRERPDHCANRRRRISGTRPVSEQIEFGLHVGPTRAGREAAGDVHFADIIVEPKPQPDIDASRREPEAGGHHADDFVRFRVHIDTPPHDCGIACEPLAPDAIADDRNVAPIVRCEWTAEQRLPAHELEVVRGDAQYPDTRTVRASHDAALIGKRGERR
jgi:hypothetical protein